MRKESTMQGVITLHFHKETLISIIAENKKGDIINAWYMETDLKRTHIFMIHYGQCYRHQLDELVNALKNGYLGDILLKS